MRPFTSFEKGEFFEKSGQLLKKLNLLAVAIVYNSDKNGWYLLFSNFLKNFYILNDLGSRPHCVVKIGLMVLLMAAAILVRGTVHLRAHTPAFFAVYNYSNFYKVLVLFSCLLVTVVTCKISETILRKI